MITGLEMARLLTPYMNSGTTRAMDQAETRRCYALHTCALAVIFGRIHNVRERHRRKKRTFAMTASFSAALSGRES